MLLLWLDENFEMDFIVHLVQRFVSDEKDQENIIQMKAFVTNFRVMLTDLTVDSHFFYLINQFNNLTVQNFAIFWPRGEESDKAIFFWAICCFNLSLSENFSPFPYLL